MKRSGPLRRGKPLARSQQRLPRRSAKRVEQDRRTEALRREVAARPCLLRGLVSTGLCAGPGTPHHLAKASAGGTTTLDNLVPLCAFHNGFVEDYPREARALGLVVRSDISPDEALRRRIAAGIEVAYAPSSPTNP